jgi:hypothetical protein
MSKRETMEILFDIKTLQKELINKKKEVLLVESKIDNLQGELAIATRKKGGE